MIAKLATIVGVYLLLSLFTFVPPLLAYLICKRSGVSLRFSILVPLGIQIFLLISVGYVVLAPGGLTPDSEFALRKAVSGRWSDLHPHGLTMLFKIISTAQMGPSGALLVFLSLIAGGTVLILSRGLTQNGVIILALISSVFFFPGTFTLFGMIWKNIFHLGIYMLAVGFCAVFLFNSNKAFRVVGILACTLLLGFGVLVSLNAPAAAVPIALLLFLPWESSHVKAYVKQTIAVLFMCLAVGLGLILGHRALTDEHIFVFASMQRHELAYLSAKTGTDMIGDAPWAAGIDWEWTQSTYLAVPSYDYGSSQYVALMRRLRDPWLSGNNEQHRRWAIEITEKWSSAILKTPFLYLKLKAMNFCGFLGIFSKPEGGAGFQENFYNSESYNFHLKQSDIARWFFENYIQPTQNSVFCSVWIYFFLGIASLVKALQTKYSLEAYCCIALIASGLLMQLSFGVLVAHYEYRWSNYFIFCIIIASAMAISLPRRTHFRSSQKSVL